MFGGNVIGAGGFGCVFRPSLKCKNNKTRKKGRISKLMSSSHAQTEYNEITRILRILRVHVPNYDHYFLLDDFQLCSPAPLSKTDLRNYTKKCRALSKKGITQTTINNQLNQLLVLEMPDGGRDMNKTKLNRDINRKLLDLLVHGIVPMNLAGVYHCDIKASNLLMDGTHLPKIIDWGLSSVYHGGQAVPKRLYRRPFQYNTPFSIILFNDVFAKQYGKLLEQNSSPSRFEIREFVISFVMTWIKKRGQGHLKLIHTMMNDMFRSTASQYDLRFPHLTKRIQEHIIEYDYTYHYIVEYLTQILVKYTKDGQMDLMAYFESVFLPNIDVWGFVMVYYKIHGFKKMAKIVNEFLLEDATQVIPVGRLVEALNSLV